MFQNAPGAPQRRMGSRGHLEAHIPNQSFIVRVCQGVVSNDNEENGGNGLTDEDRTENDERYDGVHGSDQELLLLRKFLPVLFELCEGERRDKHSSDSNLEMGLEYIPRSTIPKHPPALIHGSIPISSQH